jgi:hypothetical protein
MFFGVFLLESIFFIHLVSFYLKSLTMGTFIIFPCVLMLSTSCALDMMCTNENLIQKSFNTGISVHSTLKCSHFFFVVVYLFKSFIIGS